MTTDSERLRFLEAAFAASPDAVILVDASGRQVFASENAGRFAEGSAGKTPAEWTTEPDLRRPDGTRLSEGQTPLGRALRPLSSIVMRAEALHRLLAKREGLVSELHQANSLLAGAKRMSSMIQQIVDSCQLEAGRLPLRQEPLDLIALVERVIETTGASEQLGRVSLERPGSVPAVLADAGLIERVVGNLLGNALKYSTADRPVVVAVTAGAQEVVVAVKDRGAGIPAESLPHLFERYYRDRKVQQVEGLGLGLYISRLIMEEHGGHIWAESHLGQGSTFTFTLPTV